MPGSTCCISFDSYIKPQLWRSQAFIVYSCISFDSYIKPQLLGLSIGIVLVVYLLIPTSNHNEWCTDNTKQLVVYLLIPTSNHNRFRGASGRRKVVYLLIPTSNHNVRCLAISAARLYIFWFLHQTTTPIADVYALEGCISFDSYIKPQHLLVPLMLLCVVYLLIPTSNHNPVGDTSNCR